MKPEDDSRDRVAGEASGRDAKDPDQSRGPNGEARDSRPVRAGEALLRAAEEDPEAYPGVWRMLRLERYAREHPEFLDALRAVWEPLRRGQQAIRAAVQFLPSMPAVTAKPVQAVMAAIAREYLAQLAAIRAGIEHVDKAEFENLLDEIRQAGSEADVEWQAQFPCPRPRTVEDWQRLAARAGFPAEFVIEGEWTPADVLPIVEGYFQRVQDQRLSNADDTAGRSAAAVSRASPPDDGSPFYRPSYFKKYNIGDELLRRNATGGKKHIPGKVRRVNRQTIRGKKAVYWYSEPDARKCWPHKFADAGEPSSGA